MALVADPGPIDKSVLYDQENHVSQAIWEGQERGPLRCHEHTSLLESWKLTPRQVELVEKTGLNHLRVIPSYSLDNALISALVERWRRETNTFHLPVGEMTITLEDAGLILGLAVDGKPVATSSSETPGEVCESLLGKAPDDLSGGMLKLTWLKECFSRCPEDAPAEIVERYTRAYLLYLIGSTIFSTTTGNKVPIMYLPLFENFDEAGKFAWGSAALAILYRTLGNATFKSQGVISGSLTLLQCWSYFYLNIGLPKANEEARGSFPLARRWRGKQSGPRSSINLLAYRKALDSLSVQWLPYKDLDPSIVPDHIKNNLNLKTSKTMLICCDKAERYLPDRCMRQFGLPQPIPKKVKRWEKRIRALDEGVDLTDEVDSDAKERLQSEVKEWLDRKLLVIEDVEGVSENEYMEWYERITRKSVGRPESLESEFQRTVAAMKEIATIADSVSVDQIDLRDKKLLDEIKSSVRNCLVDIIGESRNKPGRRKSAVKRKRSGDPNVKDDDSE